METIENKTKLLFCTLSVGALLLIGEESSVYSIKEKVKTDSCVQEVLFDYRREKVMLNEFMPEGTEDLNEKSKDYGFSKIQNLSTRQNIYSINPRYKN